MYIIPMYLKYRPVTIIPEHMADVAHPDSLVRCLGDEVIKMAYEECYDITNEKDLEAIREDVLRVFDGVVTFEKMRAVWKRRRPDLELKRWYRIKMIKVDTAS